MSKLIVTGGTRLSGTAKIPGAKNAVLPILAASLLTEEPVLLRNCPHLLDVEHMLSILRTLGVRTAWEGNTIRLEPADAAGFEMPAHLSKEIRSSIFMLGPLLARFGRAHCTFPGGCDIGNRPIDLHLAGLAALNVKIDEECGNILCDGRDMKAADIHLDYPSVGATENLMMAAVAAPGRSVVSNAAREPEILDLQLFLNTLGYRVSGAGTSTIVIEGGGRGNAAEYTVMPDRIVAGTLMCAAAITAGEIKLTDVCPQDMGPVIAKLREAGCRIETGADTVALTGPERPGELKLVETFPHPGFPTDMQAQIFALCSVADGASIIVENVFENRFKHAAELARMGACSTVKDRTAIVRGVRELTGTEVYARDLRGGAALCLAALRARGETAIRRAEVIDRGYERIEETLNQLGAKIRREP